MKQRGRRRAASSVRHKYSPSTPSIVIWIPPSSSTATIVEAQPWIGVAANSRSTMTTSAMTGAGLAKEAVADKFKPRYFDVAEDIIKEAETEGYDTVVVGRRGMGTAKSLLLGSITRKVVDGAKGFAVTIVE